MKKIISMLLAVVMVIGVLPVTSFATTSDINVIEPDSWYSILLPQNASDELRNAAEELNFFLDEITGITLPVVTDDGSATADGCYISIGNTSLFQNSGNSAATLEAEASAIKTYGESILLYGGSDVGATYAMYELLEHWFDLKFYTPECYTYTAKDTVAFEELDLTSTPAVDYRTVGMYLTWYSGWTNLRRMRVSNTSEYMDGLGHSLADLLPPESYYASHPEWYSNYTSGQKNGWQLCLSNAEMRAQLIANVKAKLAADSSKKYFAIGQNDGDGFCTCADCLALNLQYSNDNTSYSGAFLALVNEIANACKDQYPNTIFYMLAYTNRTDSAPTKNITAAENVGVMYAPIDAQRTNSYFGNSGNSSYNNGRASTNLTAWSAICDHMMMWSYDAQFGDYMVPINTYDSLAANVQGYASNDFEVVFVQGSGTVLPYFETLRNYLSAKALYDGNIDTFAEVDNFINAYYGPAADAISDYFDAHLANLRAFEAKGMNYKSWVAAQYLNGDSKYSPAIIADNYSKSYVDSCKVYFDTAYAALAEAYASNTAQYATYKERIDLEYLCVLYLYLELYADQLTQEQGAQMAQQLFDIINTSDVTIISGDKINSWRTMFNVVPDAIDYTFFENTVFENKADNRECLFRSFSGNVGGKTIEGVRITSSEYQPHFNFTADAIQMIQEYAAENGYDTLRIGAYANVSSNAFVINNQLWVVNEWKNIDISIADLSTSFDFWSQSEGTSEIYLTFDYVKSEVINKNSFSGGAYTFEKYTGTIGGQDIVGIRAYSASYQPSFYFTADAVAAIKAYAEENDFGYLKIGAYANVSSNAFVLNNQAWVVNEWNSLDVAIDSLTTAFTFFSGSEGTTEVYLTFAFYKEELINKSSFTGSATFENYQGTILDTEFTGIKVTSGAYQPHFMFTEQAVSDIKAYAADNGYDKLRIYTCTGNTAYNLVLNNAVWGVGNEWRMLEINVADLTTAFDFWSTSEGTTEGYLRFEFLDSNPYDQVVYAGSFVNGSGALYSFENYAGEVGGKDMIGVKAYSNQYQPAFYFTADAVAAIKAYAEENSYNILKIGAYANVSSNAFVLNNQAWVVNEWNSLDVAIDSLTTDFTFFSGSEGTTEVYLTFEFIHTHKYNAVVTAPTCTAEGFTTYTCACGDSYVDDYVAIAAHSYANGACSVCGKAYIAIDAHSFSGAEYAFVDYSGNVGGLDIEGVKATSASYQPSFYFTADAVAAIKAYAEEKGYDILRIGAYANVSSNAFVLNNQAWVVNEWNCLDVAIDSLTTDFTFFSGSEGTTEVYLTFTYVDSNPYDQVIYSESFAGGGVTFENYQGTILNTEFTGIKVTSGAYQPHFMFTEQAVSDIKAYAADNGYDKLRIYTCTGNTAYNLVLNNAVWGVGNEWRMLEINVADLTTAFDFWSTSEGTTEGYLRFEFLDSNPYDQVVYAGSFVNGSGALYSFENYAGEVGGKDMIGVKAYSNQYQPAFYFTADAVAAIKAYAEENSYNILKIGAYANVSSNAFVLNNQAWVVNEWNSLDVAIDSLTTDFTFFSGSEGTTEVYLTFEFVHEHAYGDWVVTVPATLQAAGEQQKTCSCGDVITEEIPCLAGDVESWGLTLGGDLSVNFMISVHEDIRETAKIVITVAGDADEFVVTDLSANPDNGLFYVSVNVAAAQMNDTITVQIVNGEDASVTKEYTVAQYAKAILANDSYSTYHALVKEMLNYGDAAQTYFGYNVDNRTDVNLEGVGAVEVPANAAADMAVSGKVDGISFYGASLLFRNKIAVRYYFTVTGDVNSYKFTVNGTEYEPVLKDNLYYIEVADINPQDLDDAITVTVNDTLTVSYSPMNYIVRMSTKGSDNLKALMKALYNYHLAAEIIVPDVA